MSLAESCKKEKINFTVDLGDPANAALTHAGGYIYYETVIVVCVTTSNYMAFAKTCTHSGCTVAFNGSNDHLECPCHGGTYDTNGTVIAGPPPKNLKKYTVVQNGNILTING
ncbi:MAG: Rieske 2Fe-2S domain-containing protein [Bacteroidetes bacterium]|nr:Rieske 2Fe-2S domain-containing protein [Bacteroidota bacterium]